MKLMGIIRKWELLEIWGNDREYHEMAGVNMGINWTEDELTGLQPDFMCRG